MFNAQPITLPNALSLAMFVTLRPLLLLTVILAAGMSAEGENEAPATTLDNDTRARAEAAADRFLAGDAGAAAIEEADAERLRARELGALTEDQQLLITELNRALTQAENFIAAGDGLRAGDGFLVARSTLLELEEGLKEQLPTTLPWLEQRVSKLALQLLNAPDLAVPRTGDEPTPVVTSP